MYHNTSSCQYLMNFKIIRRIICDSWHCYFSFFSICDRFALILLKKSFMSGAQASGLLIWPDNWRESLLNWGSPGVRVKEGRSFELRRTQQRSISAQHRKRESQLVAPVINEISMLELVEGVKR
jgi:hypothetical protein